MASNLGLRKPYQIQLPEQAQDIDAMFEQLYRRIGELEALIAAGGSGAAAPHDLLSTQHSDTTAAAEVNGDLIAGQAGAWARLPVGVDAQVLEVVSGAPAWSNDGSGLEDLDATEIVGTVPTASVVHSMLSAHHQDSEPATGILGDMIVAQTGDPVDAQANWWEGEPYDVLATADDPGAGDYWIDGGAWGSLLTLGGVTWQRKAVGTDGYVWTASPTGPDWQPGAGAGGSSAAAAYRSSDFTISDVTVTTVTLQATSFDDGGFWSAAAPTRLTVPTGQGGTYVVTGTVTVDSAFVGLVYAFLYVNGVLKATGPSGGKNATAPFVDPASVVAVLKLNSTDYVELKAEIRNNTVGASFTVKGGATQTFLQLGRLVSESSVVSELPSAVAGSMLKGDSGGTAWDRLAIGAANTVLLSDGAAPGWSTRPTLRDVAEAVSGVWDFTNGWTERGRSAKVGEWTDVAYNAGNFTATGAMTWTVDLADQLTYAYMLVGKTMTVAMVLAATSVGGVLGNQLWMAVPGGFTVAKTVYSTNGYCLDNLVATPIIIGSVVGDTIIRVNRFDSANFTAAANTTYMRFTFTFEVQ